MICTSPTAPGPSAPRVTRSYSAPVRSCASSYAAAYADTNGSRDAIFPFPGPAPTLHHRELYLRALEQEREEILTAAYASRRSNSSPGSGPSSGSDRESKFNSPSSTPPSPEAYDYDVVSSDSEDDDSDSESSHSRLSPRFDDRGRQLTFRETVRQRQARLEFLRRQDFARRIAHRGLAGDPNASAYAIKRLPPPRKCATKPIERVNAAIKIQRAWRIYRAVTSLEEITLKVHEEHARFEKDVMERWEEEAYSRHAEVLHQLLGLLGERTGVLSTNDNAKTNQKQSENLHPRARAAARTAMEALRAELAMLDRAQVSRRFSVSSTSSQQSCPSFLEEDSDSYSDSDSESDLDSEGEDYASYIYTPPQLISTELYVVDEEDEEVSDSEPDLIHDDQHRQSSQQRQSPVYSYSFSSPSSKYSFESQKIQTGGTHHQRSRHAPLVSPTPIPAVNVPASLVRSPVSRSPSLASIPEEGEEF